MKTNNGMDKGAQKNNSSQPNSSNSSINSVNKPASNSAVQSDNLKQSNVLDGDGAETSIRGTMESTNTRAVSESLVLQQVNKPHSATEEALTCHSCCRKY